MSVASTTGRMQHPSLVLLTRLANQPAIVNCGLLYPAAGRMSLSAEKTGLDFNRPPHHARLAAPAIHTSPEIESHST